MIDPERPSPLDPASAGWHLTPRAWRASEVYRALRTAERRHVAELILFDRPRFRDETHWFGGQPFVVKRGQLFDGEERLAELAGTSRKVVRTVLELLMASGLVSRARVHPSGQCPHVITVHDYELSQSLPAKGASGTAKGGPETGQRGAPSNPMGTPEQPLQPGAHDEPPAWTELRARLAGSLRPDLWRRWFAPLSARVEGAVLVVECPDRHHRAFLADNYAPLLVELLQELNHPLEIRFAVAGAPRLVAGEGAAL